MSQKELDFQSSAPEEAVRPPVTPIKEKLASLSRLQREVLFLCAIIYQPVEALELLKCARIAGILDEEGSQLTQGKMAETVALLRSGFWLTSGRSVRCKNSIIEAVMFEASKNSSFDQNVRAVRAVWPVERSYWNFDSLVREIRLAIYQKDMDAVIRHMNYTNARFPHEFGKLRLLERIFADPFRPEWLQSMPRGLQLQVLTEFGGRGISRLQNIDPYVTFAKKCLERDGESDFKTTLRNFLSEALLLQGNITQVRRIAEDASETMEGKCLLASIDFLQDRNDLALKGFREAQRVYRKVYGSGYTRNLTGLFHMLAIIKTNDIRAMAPIEKMVLSRDVRPSPYQECYSHIHAYWLAKSRHSSATSETLFQQRRSAAPDPVAVLTRALVIRWLHPERLHECEVSLAKAYFMALGNGYNWLAMEYGTLLSNLPQRAELREPVAQLRSEIETTPLMDLVPYEPEWQRSLKALTALDLGGRMSDTGGSARLVWTVDFENRIIEPKEQKRSASGWTKGRRVSFRALRSLTCLTLQDIAIADSLEYEWYGFLSEESFNKALLVLAGHPLVFLYDSPAVAVEIRKGSPELIVENKDGRYEVGFSVPMKNSVAEIVKETPTRYKVYEITPVYSRIAEMLGGKKLAVPEEGKEALLKAVAHLSSAVMVHSEVGGEHEEIPVVESNNTCVIHLLPKQGGFRLEIFVRPFGEEGPCFTPGYGGQTIIAEVGGRRIQSRRDLNKELESLQEILEACPSLAANYSDSPVWEFYTPEECIAVLSDLNPLREKVPVEWPQGGRISVTAPVSFEHFKGAIKKDNDWFGISGEIKVNDSRVIQMRELLELADRNKGRFIPMADGQFLALTEAFRKSLDDINAILAPGKKDVRIHPLAALSLQDHLEQFENLETDSEWRAHIQRASAIEHVEPKLPSTLQVQLRDYQLTGFRWLSRLAKWGAGACLADDMGLGKTVQVLAAILERAATGPALVVCPASVTFNWLQEANRFAPTLNVRMFGGKERADLLKEAKPFDLFVCSYTLMHFEAEILTQIHWSTIVLDEAQAIKNVFTRRAQSAMELQGDFKIITTGTPVENHLGELWSLFNFINPGLLGSIQNFNTRFAVPIEKHKDVAARNRLRRLIQPFVLRRMKSEVLDELPPKTEITLKVEMTEREASLYEALRLRTLEKLANLSGAAGEKHLRILAEIMKLRRACCHMSLIHPEMTEPNSKLAMLEQVVNDLLENRHKALVFSQFVDFLQIIRNFIEAKGIRYQYLDGSTPVKEREKRVAAFQAGDGDLFLISLRAGGQGLNLTAADYVIHMDPWWNPAVEDQASDRAHRIGQQRPVTIYRLICSKTIEEKIVTLHRDKRDLAQSLLEGADASGKITAEQLLALIRET